MGMTTSRNRPEVSLESRRIAAAAQDLMRERGISQADLAQQISRAQTYVSARLRGALPIEMDMLNALAKRSGISLTALLIELQERSAATGTTSVPARPAHERSRSRGQGARGTSRGSSL